MSGYSESVNAASTDPDRVWYELAIDVHAEAVEPVSELLGRYGFNHGVSIDEPYVQDKDGDNLEIDLDKPFTIRTWVADSDFDPALAEEIRSALWHLGQMRPVSDLRVTTLAEEDWANAWKEHFQTHKIGDRVVIRPPWLEYEPQGDEVVVELDPGMAFGTGLHPSTQLTMLGVEETVREGDAVLDVGTGSGILAIAALKLGAKHVDAVDVRHGSVGPGEPFQGQYDVVFANIIARILIELSEPIIAATKPGAPMVLAGIIQEREADVIAAFEALGATVVNRRQHDDWVSLVLRRDS